MFFQLVHDWQRMLWPDVVPNTKWRHLAVIDWLSWSKGGQGGLGEDVCSIKAAGGSSGVAVSFYWCFMWNTGWDLFHILCSKVLDQSGRRNITDCHVSFDWFHSFKIISWKVIYVTCFPFLYKLSKEKEKHIYSHHFYSYYIFIHNSISYWNPKPESEERNRNIVWFSTNNWIFALIWKDLFWVFHLFRL